MSDDKQANRDRLNIAGNRFLEASGRRMCRVLRGGVLSVQKWGIDALEPTGETIDGSRMESLPAIGEMCVVLMEPYPHVEVFDGEAQK